MDVAAVFQVKNEVRIFRFIMFIITLILAIYSYMAFADSGVSEKIYTDLQSNHYCNRRLSNTKQMGCTSQLGGNSGVVWKASTRSDIDHVLKTGPTPPYIVIMNPDVSSRQLFLEFKANLERVAGVVILNITDDVNSIPLPESSFSPEDSCPNRDSGLYVNDPRFKDCKVTNWLKSEVSGLLQDDIPYPIFFINEPKSISEINSCFDKNHYLKDLRKYQGSYPLCGMQLDSFMLAAQDTQTCLNTHSLVDALFQTSGRRCINVENQNIFAYYNLSSGDPVVTKDGVVHPIIKDNSLVLLTAKLSSMSMFTDISPGADSTITSLIALLAVAEALGNETIHSYGSPSSDRNIAFAFLDSEPFDYTGSVFVTERMKKNLFPINSALKMDPKQLNSTMKNVNITSLDYVIDLDQLATYSNDSEIFLHFDPTTANFADPKLRKLSDIFKESSRGLSVQFNEERDLPLPPTSLQQFILSASTDKAKPSTPNFIGAVMTNYRREFANRFYHSVFDNADNIGLTKNRDRIVDHLYKVSSIIASASYKLAFGKSVEVFTNKELINDLLDCYLIDASCTLFTRAMSAGQSLPKGPIMTYRDPTSPMKDINGLITANLMAYFLGIKETNLNSTECKKAAEESYIYYYHYLNGKDEPVRDGSSGICIKSQVGVSEYYSLAYSENDGIVTVDSRYPAWSVSYDGIRNPVRVFMIPSRIYQWSLFVTGVVITLISFSIVSSVKKSFSQIENDQEQAITPT